MQITLSQSLRNVAIQTATLFLLAALLFLWTAPAHAWWSSWVRIDAQKSGTSCDDVQVQVWPHEGAEVDTVSTLQSYRDEGMLLPVGQSFEVSVWGCGGYADKTIHVIDAWDQVKHVNLK